jgi:YD repeat-containing protein
VLTVTAGTEVWFDGGELDVSGRLSAVGTAEAPITFARVDGSILDNVRIGSNDGSHLSYVIIRGGDRGLHLENSAPTLDHVSFIENEIGLYVDNTSHNVTVSASNFAGNADYGVYNANWSATQVDASENYWNSPDGPNYSGSNPEGDEVSYGVTYDDWLKKPSFVAGVSYVLTNHTDADHTVLAHNTSTDTYTRYYPDGREVHFDAQGRHAYTLEADGRQTVYTYTSTGRLEGLGIVAPGESEARWEWTFEYDAQGKLQRVHDPAGRSITFTVDAGDQLAQVVWPDGSERRFYYDARGLMTQQVDGEGHVTDYVYDEHGRLTQHLAPQRPVYDAQSGQTTVSRQVKTFTTSDTGYPLLNDSAVGDPDDPAPAVLTSTLLVDEVAYERGGVSGHTNVWGNWLDETDALSRTTTYARDGANNLTQLTWPEENCVEAAYDELGHPLSAARMGATQCAQAPGEREPTQVQTVTLTYEARFGQVKTLTDPLGRTTTYTYDYELDLTCPGGQCQGGEAGKLVRIAYPAVRDENGVTTRPVVSYTYRCMGLSRGKRFLNLKTLH